MSAGGESGTQAAARSEPGPAQEEARAIVDAARAAGATVRLVGGLGVLEHCHHAAVCRREHRDIDLVGLRREIKVLDRVLTGLGFEENRHVRLASAGWLAQFFRPCIHARAGRRVHDDDRVDVYLDTFRLHHEIALAKRLGLHDYAVSASDALLVKLQRTVLDEADLADIVSLLESVRFGQGGDEVDAGYIARLCGRDWGLWHDVHRTLDRTREVAGVLSAGRAEARRVTRAVDELQQSLDGEGKSLRWRVRSLAGERLPWHDVVDERDGARLTVLERPAARRGA